MHNGEVVEHECTNGLKHDHRKEVDSTEQSAGHKNSFEDLLNKFELMYDKDCN